MDSPKPEKKNWVSEIVWAVIIGVALVWELIAVFGGEKRWGIEPLTRLTRDRGMRKHPLAWLAGAVGLAWLVLHFLAPGLTPVA